MLLLLPDGGKRPPVKLPAPPFFANFYSLLSPKAQCRDDDRDYAHDAKPNEKRAVHHNL